MYVEDWMSHVTTVSFLLGIAFGVSFWDYSYFMEEMHTCVFTTCDLHIPWQFHSRLGWEEQPLFPPPLQIVNISACDTFQFLYNSLCGFWYSIRSEMMWRPEVGR